MKTKQLLLAIVILAAFFVAFIPIQHCVTSNGLSQIEVQQQISIQDASGQYLINEPSRTVTLGTKLAEISGLSLAPDGYSLLAVQDEKGRAFTVNPADGVIIDDVKFGGSDDYEGIEYFGDEIFVTNSKGSLDVWKVDRTDDEKRTENTFLTSDYDVEGLGALPNGPLLLACKSAKTKADRNRKVFALNPKDLDVDTIPFLDLNHAAISALLGRPETSPIFSPSGIAVHPVSHNIYLISSPAKALVVYSSTGSLIQAVELSKAVHAQPEGIAFGKDGTLYVSNEANGGFAKIHIFHPS